MKSHSFKILQTKCDQALWNGDVNTDMDDVYEVSCLLQSNFINSIYSYVISIRGLVLQYHGKDDKRHRQCKP